MRLIKSCKYVDGKINIPPSKSIIQRLLAGIYLSQKKSVIKNRSYCSDERAVINILNSLGVKFNISDSIEVKGYNNKIKKNICVGESGLATRIFSIILSKYNKTFKISGKGSIKRRNFKELINVLKKLDVEISSKGGGKLPFKIKGPIKIDKKINIDCKDTSQVLTGLLMLGPALNKDFFIDVDNIVSKSYIKLTIKVLNEFGITVENYKYEKFFIKANQKYKKINTQVEGDWSSAAILMVLAALKGRIKFKNINTFSSQGDKIIIEILKKAGAKIIFNKDFLTVEKNKLNSFEFDATNYPDLIPPIVILASRCKGKSIIYGAERLKNKESNRLNSILKQYSKIGIKVFKDDNKIIVKKSKITGGVVDSEGDHRIEMCLAVAGLLSKKSIKICNSETVVKSYRNFYKDIKNVVR